MKKVLDPGARKEDQRGLVQGISEETMWSEDE